MTDLWAGTKERGPQSMDLRGQKYGMLTVVKFVEKVKADKGFHKIWQCVCECGGTRQYSTKSLRGGQAKSCGCIRSGVTKHELYHIWKGMKNRCYNTNDQNYKNWGGRGIVVCNEWKDSFNTFLRYVGPRPTKDHTLERINTDGNYEPGNVKWATRKEQARNLRTNRVICYMGMDLTCSEWTELVGTPSSTMHNRLRFGWSPEEVIFGRGGHG